jgi:hypothetical protein
MLEKPVVLDVVDSVLEVAIALREVSTEQMFH